MANGYTYWVCPVSAFYGLGQQVKTYLFEDRTLDVHDISTVLANTCKANVVILRRSMLVRHNEMV